MELMRALSATCSLKSAISAKVIVPNNYCKSTCSYSGCSAAGGVPSCTSVALVLFKASFCNKLVASLAGLLLLLRRFSDIPAVYFFCLTDWSRFIFYS